MKARRTVTLPVRSPYGAYAASNERPAVPAAPGARFASGARNHHRNAGRLHEQDIAALREQLASLPAARVASTSQSFGVTGSNVTRIENNMVPIAIVFTIFVLAPIALSISRLFWKRASMPRQAVVQSPENAQRLERMEQAIDSIAIEMERVSEGQRFVTRLLSEGRMGAVAGEGQRAAQPVSVPLSEKGALPRY